MSNKTISDNDLYYLLCIRWRLGELSKLADAVLGADRGGVLGGKAFNEEREWLSNFIIKHEHNGREKAKKPRRVRSL